MAKPPKRIKSKSRRSANRNKKDKQPENLSSHETADEPTPKRLSVVRPIDEPVLDDGLSENDIVTARDDGENPDIEMELEELHQYKIMAWTAKAQQARDRVRLPILERKRQEMAQELNQALREDNEFQKASAKQQEAVDEIKEACEDDIPPGYELIRIDPEDGIALYRYRG